ncbi:uncharacterized protein F4807DRAFT_470294 [Annulohypoxylon truncatum]|uniref:uncharacterized protein n=1 Tax=Annulohypoxylon truncatum TaxID=327061 RepID=UPI0020076101|nr:uncharacterized protein F4807DRAFT_470294 [Annulohypoxylon truncatum]KAI1206308.1 hypothetical protein F4807DRAFT_470294 [Annulohypoxylon truncatum]
MGEESEETDGTRSPEKNEDAKETQVARISRKLAESQQLIDRVKDKFTGIDTAKFTKGDTKSITNDSRGRRPSTISQRLSASGNSSRRSSLSAKGKELLKKHVNIPRVKQDIRPKQKDPLHQWMVENTGGVLREKC